MSHARQVFKRSTVAIVRRCSEERFFLKPSRWVNQILSFLLAHYATKHGIELHGFAFMANHFHLVLTDPRGRLPLFMGEFDSRSRSSSRGRFSRGDPGMLGRRAQVSRCFGSIHSPREQSG